MLDDIVNSYYNSNNHVKINYYNVFLILVIIIVILGISTIAIDICCKCINSYPVNPIFTKKNNSTIKLDIYDEYINCDYDANKNKIILFLSHRINNANIHDNSIKTINLKTLHEYQIKKILSCKYNDNELYNTLLKYR